MPSRICPEAYPINNSNTNMSKYRPIHKIKIISVKKIDKIEKQCMVKSKWLNFHIFQLLDMNNGH